MEAEIGIFDDIFGSNTTSAQDAAAAANTAMLQQTGASDDRTLRNTTNQANQALQTGATGATTALNTGYGNATGALTNYTGQAQGALSSGVDKAVGTVEGGNASFQPYATNGGAATGMLSNALGLNGAAGNAAATSAFQSAPGYQYSVNQATDAATRAAAAAGMGASGNTLKAVTTLGQNLANQNYQQYLTNLQGVAGQGLTAASGISGNNQAAGTAQLAGGTQGANLFQTLGQNLGNADIGQGTSLAGVQTGLGSALSGNDTALGSNIAKNDLGIANAVAGISTVDAQADDKAANTNSGIFSKALGSFFAPEISSASKAVSSFL